MSMIAVILSTSTSFLGRSTRLAERIESTLQYSTNRQIARSWFDQIPLSPAGITKSGYISGTSGELTATLWLYDGVFFAGSPIEVALKMENETLYLLAEGVADRGQTPIKRDIVLYDNVEAIEIRYLSSSGVWQDRWENMANSPLLIHIMTQQTGGGYNPPISLRPHFQERQSVRSVSSLLPPG